MKRTAVSGIANRSGSIIAFVVMILSVLAVYWPQEYESGRIGLVGSDHMFLHMRRIAFAQEALMGSSHALPGWYPSELMGTPFWSNVQNFPFLPTRLLVVLLVDPLNALTVGAILAALVSAALTFFFCRRIDLSPVASAAAGWTFACAGYFAARVLAGHLPFLEAYPALPLLLLLAENALQTRDKPAQFSRSLLWLGLASACVPLAGHPQLPVYAMSATGIYVLYRDRRRAGMLTLAAMALGALVAAFAFWPMLQLTARSTRVLALDPAANDIALPYGRLGAFFLPWKDGWPQGVSRHPSQPFTDYPNAAYFWDTVCYVGWAPWIGMLILLLHRIRNHQPFDRRLKFIFIVGAAALAFSLPAWQAVMAHVPGTILRSPARQLYLTTFALALGLGAAIDCVKRIATGSFRPAVFSGIAFALLAHGFDLGSHARAFVVSAELPEVLAPEVVSAIAKSIGNGRIGMDCTVISEANRRLDDVGFFDSIMLARSYQGLLSLNGDPPGLNVQKMDGSRLKSRALAALGVHFVVTKLTRSDLMDLIPQSEIHIYQVPNPADRAAFFPDSSSEVLPTEQIHERLRDQTFDPSTKLLLRKDEAELQRESAATPSSPTAVSYRRTKPDEIEVGVNAPVPGWVRVLESWDPGWHATVDGTAVPLVAGNDIFLALPVAAGTHQIRLRFETPGAWTGRAISIIAILGLLGLAWHVARGKGKAP